MTYPGNDQLEQQLSGSALSGQADLRSSEDAIASETSTVMRPVYQLVACGFMGSAQAMEKHSPRVQGSRGLSSLA